MFEAIREVYDIEISQRKMRAVSRNKVVYLNANEG